MRRVVGILILWLLVAAVPVQGMAAVTMIACGPDHAAGTSNAAGSIHDHRQDHRHETGALHLHMDSGAAQGQDDAKPLPDGTTRLAEAFAHKCSACASCCIGAALLLEPLTLDSVNPTEFFAPLAPSSVAAFVSEGLERPPRLFLA